MDITPEDSLEPDAAPRLQEGGNTLRIGAPGRGKTALISGLVRDEDAARGIPDGLDGDGATVYWLPGRPQLQHPSVFMSPESLEELRNSRVSVTYRIPADPGGGITAGLSADLNHLDPHHTKES